MEKPERDLILALLPTNHELRKLYQEHLRLDQAIIAIERTRAHLSTQQLGWQRLKKQKLHGMDRILEIVSINREGQNDSGGPSVANL